MITDDERRLSGIVNELRNENRQSVSRNEWYIYAVMTVIPFAGVLFFALTKEKNINKSNYAKAGVIVNAVLSVITAVCLITSVFCVSAGQKNVKAQKYSGVTETEENSGQEEEVKAQPFIFDSQSNSISFELNGIAFNYPLSARELEQAGLTYDTQTSSPFSMNTVTAAYKDIYGSTVLITYDTQNGEEAVCDSFSVKLSSETSFLGLTEKSGYEAVTEMFKNAVSQEMSEYDTASATGIIYFDYGSCEIGVSLKNNMVSSAFIKG